MIPTVLALLGMMIAAAGLWAIVSPERFHEYAVQWLLPAGRWVGVIPRVILAAALWLAADDARTPVAFAALALGFLVGGLAILMTGTDGLRSRIERLTHQPVKLARELTQEWAVAIVVFGWFLVWAVVPVLPN